MSPRGLTRATIDKRASVVRRYVSAVTEWETATVHDVERWLGGLGVGASTTADYLSHVRAFYRWAARHDLVHVDPTRFVELPRRPRRLPRPARPVAIKVALAAAGPAVRAMIALMSGAGLRCCEIAGLRWVDVDLLGGRLRVEGKGNHQRVIDIGPSLRRALAAIDHSGDHVFLSPTTGAPYRPSRVSALVNQHLAKCAAGCTAHQLRHWFATVTLEMSGDLTIVRDLLGHQHVATTEIYAQVARGAASRVSMSVDVPGL